MRRLKGPCRFEKCLSLLSRTSDPGEAAPHLSVSGTIIFRQAVDLTIGELRGNRAHAAVDVVAPLTGRKHLELGGQVFLPLLVP